MKFFFDEVYFVGVQLSLIGWFDRNTDNRQKKILELPSSIFSNLYSDVIDSYLCDSSVEVVVGKTSDQVITDAGASAPIDFVGETRYFKTAVRAVFFVLGFFFANYQRIWGHVRGASKNRKTVVGFCSGEGIDLDKRSDIFWYPESGLQTSDVVIYFGKRQRPFIWLGRSRSRPARWDEWSREHLGELNQMGFRVIKPTELLLLKGYQNYQIRSRYRQLLARLSIEDTRARPLVKYSEATTELARYFVKKVRSWHGVFSSVGIKIHWESTNSETGHIIKSVALTEVGGASLGKERSFATTLKGALLGNYPNDVFFVWGKESAGRIRETVNAQQSIVVSGHPYDSNRSNRFKSRAEKKVKDMRCAGANFFILLLDNGNNDNEGLQQQMYTKNMIDFYSRVLQWVLGEPDVGLIIKSKKKGTQPSLPEITNLISRACDNGQCYNFPDGYQIKPVDLCPFIDVVIATGPFFSGALVESVLRSGARGVFLDYPKLERFEEKIYSWGENQVIYQDLDLLLDDMKRFKENEPGFSNFGSWEGQLDNLDPYRDGRGGERIGYYVSKLQKEIDAGLSVDAAIKSVNRSYADIWGSNSVVEIR